MQSNRRSLSATIPRAIAMLTAASMVLGILVAAAASGAPTPTAVSNVAYDGFEAEFPAGVWTVADEDGTFDTDFWGLSTARASSGSTSLWSAAVGSRTDVTNLFTEGFESGAMPDGWSSGDADSYYGLDYWGPSNYKSNTGTYSLWSAQVGDNEDWGGCEKRCDEDGFTFPPNTDIRRYDSNTQALVSVDVDVSMYSYADLTYSFWMSTEEDYDFFYVFYSDASGPHLLDERTGASSGWEQGTTRIPKAALSVGFYFETDTYTTAEGVYVDDVSLDGTLLEDNADSGLYDDGMHRREPYRPQP